MSDIPKDWAMRRVVELTAVGLPDGFSQSALVNSALADAFARYISEHEQPPVDSLLLEARNVAASCQCAGVSELTLSGRHDGQPIVQATLAALRRGMELAKDA